MERRKASYPKEIVENADLHQPGIRIMRKISFHPIVIP